jgi:CRISPR-associated protein Csd1
MSWLQKLYETYSNCVEASDSESDDYGICPIAHTNKKINIEITLDKNGNFQNVEIVNEETVIPTTDDNNCMWSLAVDIKTYKNKKETYKKRLEEWSKSDHNNEKLQAINTYIKKGKLIDDLVENKILWKDNSGNFIKKPKKKNEEDQYPIFANIEKQEDCFIRWVVGDNKDRHTWKDKDGLIESWKNFREHELEKGFCYVTGNNDVPITENHPYANGSAKLISSQDKQNFVFNGRFSNPNEILTLSFEVSQKAHKTLQWLMRKERGQAYSNEVQKIVAFNVHGQGGDVGLIFGENFVKATKGYNYNVEEIKPNENIMILGMDAANKGRAAITYYKEILGSKYIENINNWHKKYNWEQYLEIKNNGNKQYKYFEGTPAIDTIATVYLYKKDKYSIDKKEIKIKKKLIRELMPSVLEGKSIPKYIEEKFIAKASNPLASDKKLKQWKTVLGIACSIYNGNNLYKDSKGERGSQMLDEKNETRDYLYGRLLALIDYGEEEALKIQQKDNEDDKDEDKRNLRLTNAKRYMRQFSLKPYSTWKMLYLRYNEAYLPRLRKNNYPLQKKIEKSVEDIKDSFSSSNFKKDTKLDGIYLLGYFQQLKNLRYQTNKPI